MYLSLNGDIIPNHGYVTISDIGSTDDTALICHTNRPATFFSFNTHSGGRWIRPSGRTVTNLVRYGMYRSRAVGMVRLIRYRPSAPQGIYRCVVEDATLTQQRVYVGLYYSRGGMCAYTPTQCRHTW